MLADAEKAKSKAVTAAEKLDAVRQAKKYRRMVEELSKPDDVEQAQEQTIQPEEPTGKAQKTASAQAEEATDDKKFAEQPELNGNHEGMTAIEQADGTHKWVGLQRSEVTEGMSEREIALLDEFGRRMGLPIVAKAIADSRFNGMYRDGVVYINPNRDKQWTVRWVAGHELLHDIEKLSPETYNAYKEAVKALWGDAYFEDKVKDTMDIYAEAGHPIDRAQAEKEVVNDYGGDLFSSRDGMKIMQGILDKAGREGKPEFVKRLMEWWDRIKEFFTSSPYYADVQKAMEKAYTDAMKNANERLRADDGKAEMSAKRKRAHETAEQSQRTTIATAVSSADGTKILNNLDNLVNDLEKSSSHRKTFIGDLANAFGVDNRGKASKYATFETKNGKVVTIRLSNHNATVSNFDSVGESDGISIVVTRKPNKGITNDGMAHIVEFFYPEIALQRAEGKPLAEIAKSIKQVLYSGEFKDTTGLAEIQEVNRAELDREPLSARIESASAEVNTEPTEAQKEAGNYKKGHIKVGKFDISIEQPEGSIRRGTDADGKQWESKMNNTYGYFRGTEGVDGDHIDVFLSNNMDGWNGEKAFVVDQYNPDGTFDEHKVMLGFNDASEAKSDYLANYEKGWENGRRIDITGVNLEDFEKWIESSKRKTKPFGEYKSIKSAELGGEEFSIKKSGDQAEYSVKKENTDEERKITPVGEREKALRDAVIGRMRKSGIDVIDNDTEGQRVLDMVNGRGEPMRSQAMLSSLAKAANTIHGWLATGNRGKSFTIELPESTRRMIRKVMGRDFESHNITANGVAHAQKNHGVEGNKISERSIPLREQDMELIPYIMVAPDYVRKGSEDVTGRTSVRFYKELSNGYVVVAEKEYKNSPDDMETITMWAEMSDKATNAQRTAAPDTHVQNAILDIDVAKIRKDAEDAIKNDNKVKKHRVYHGSGADFEAFDHSHMGEGDMLGVKYTSADDVADKVLSDLLEGVNPTDPDGGGKWPDESIIDYAKRKAEEYSIKKSFGGNSGYVGYSKSKRAVDAEDRGLRSVSNMDREFAEEVSEIVSRESGKEAKVSLAEVKRIAKDMRGDEWHHTSKYGNRTQYYSAESIAERILADREPKSEELVADDKERESALERVRDMLVTDKDVKTKVEDRGREHEYTNDAFTSSNGYQIVVGKGMFGEKRTFRNTQFLNNGKVDKRELYLPEWYVDDHIDVLQKAMDEYNARLDDALGKEAESVDTIDINGHQFSIKNQEDILDAVNKTFNEELQKQIDGTLPKNHIYKMGKPGKVLLSTGVPNLPIQMSAQKLYEKATMFDHDFELSEVKDLVKELQHPLAVFEYGDKHKAQNVIVSIQKNGKNFIVGLSLNPNVGGRRLEINSIRNVFPKDNSEWLNWITQRKALYLDKEKIQTLIDQQRTNLADVEYLDLDDLTNLIKIFGNPKFSDKDLENTTEFSNKGGKSLDERLNSKYVRTRYNAAKEMCRDNDEALDILADTTPHTIEELIAESLSGAKGVKLLWEDDGVKRGLKAHLGYGNEERRMMSGFLSPDGISPEHFAEQLEASAEHLGIEHGDTMDIFGKVLDTVAGRSKRELGDMLLNNRIDRALDVVRKQEEWAAEQEQEYLDTLLPAMREEYLAQKAELEAVKWMPEKEKAKYLADKRRERMLAEMSDAEREEVLAKQRWYEDNKYILSDAFRRERSNEQKAAKSKLQEKYDTLKTSFDKLLKQQSERATRNAINGKEDKERIKDSTRKEEADKVREIADQMREFIEQAVPKDLQDDMTRFDFTGVLKSLETATTTKDLEKPMRTVDEIGTYLASRALNKQLGAILNKKYRSTNAKGVSVARAVDNSTRVVMDYAKQLYREMNNNGVSQQLFGLRLDRKDIMDEFRKFAKAQDDANVTGVLDKVEKIMKAKQDKRMELLSELHKGLSVEDATKVGEYLSRLESVQGLIDATIKKGNERITKAPENAVEAIKTLKQEIDEREEAGTMSEDDRAMQKSFYNLESFGFYKTSLV